jgi:hypothetical protein
MKKTNKECIKSLLGTSWEVARAELKKFSIAELEEMAMSIRVKDDSPEKDLREWMLEERQKRMNQQFVYTPEHIRQMVKLNEIVTDALEMMCREAEKELLQMQKRKRKNDPFLHDYGVECKLTPYIYVKDEESGDMCEPDEGIDALLIETLPEYVLWWFEGDTSERLRDRLYFSEDLNWNECDGFSNGELSDYYINYAMHELFHHTYFSLSDILRINWLWAEVQPLRQHFIENIVL